MNEEQTQKVTEVRTVIESTNNLSQLLVDRVASLSERLAPILREENTVESDCSKEESPQVSLAREIKGANSRLIDALNGIESILDRLEL